MRVNVDRLADLGPSLEEPHTRQLDGKLRELRFYLAGQQTRISYWIAPGRRIVLLTVFVKTQRQERREIRRAKQVSTTPESSTRPLRARRGARVCAPSNRRRAGRDDDGGPRWWPDRERPATPSVALRWRARPPLATTVARRRQARRRRCNGRVDAGARRRWQPRSGPGSPGPPPVSSPSSCATSGHT